MQVEGASVRTGRAGLLVLCALLLIGDLGWSLRERSVQELFKVHLLRFSQDATLLNVLIGAMPALLSGVRISASIGIILLTAAEMIGAQFGIGALVLAAGNLMQTDRLIAGVLLLSGLGLSVAFLIGWAEKSLLKWR